VISTDITALIIAYHAHRPILLLSLLLGAASWVLNFLTKLMLY